MRELTLNEVQEVSGGDECSQSTGMLAIAGAANAGIAGFVTAGATAGTAVPGAGNVAGAVVGLVVGAIYSVVALGANEVCNAAKEADKKQKK